MNLNQTYIFSPILGLHLEVEFVNPDENEINKLKEWQSSYVPSSNKNILINYRRKMFKTLMKFSLVGFPQEMTCAVLDYFTNSNHLDKFEKIANEKNIKNGWLVILGQRFQFIKDNMTMTKSMTEEYKRKIQAHLGLISNASNVIRKMS